ncbi:hypothetical protein QWJ34_08010 [Saccharibacillus sp. CPCC 101409]|uniref:hypothetical protein n=1 Tax=Saccharibacillus sp. CPCC 101409 TaxID=3058041 RepID=UPI002673F559|nr:hypothetical protein [Saccharibacillus sp. CPCC 101409]MDO3409706.1 hypothetical protein [Saccharibacillus sp. CPCC 101409]
MTNNSLTTQFLKNRDLWQLILTLASKKQDSEGISVGILDTAETPINLSIYETLATEYNQFLQEGYLSNISLVINGIDGQLFSSDQEEDLISRAYGRLETPLFGEGLEIFRNGFELHVVWTPPIPVKLTDSITEREEETRRNIIYYFDNELKLMVQDVNLRSLKDSRGWESFFYEKYFLPKKFKEIVGDQDSQNSSPQEWLENEEEPCVMDYILTGKRALLQDIVDKQLPDSLGFDICIPEPFVPTDSTCLFLPFFEARIKLVEDMSAVSVINTITRTYELIDCKAEAENTLVVSCRCNEGPYTFTVDDIVRNILHNLGPKLTAFFEKEELRLEKLFFTMTTME